MAIIFQKEMNTLFHGTMISVTQVTVSPDIGVAKIHLSFFPIERRTEGMKMVEEQKVHLRHALATQTGKQLRKIPELIFILDDSLDRVEEIERLLKK